MHVRSNLPALASLARRNGYEHSLIVPSRGFSGLFTEWRAARHADLVLVDGDSRLILMYCILKLALPRRVQLWSMDIVVSRPQSLFRKVTSRLWRLLLKSVDHFILYHTDLAGYERFYGISPRRSTTVAFKANVWQSLNEVAGDCADEGYILCLGRSHRDIDTLFAACRLTQAPVLWVRQSTDLVRDHGTKIPAEERPPNLKEVIHDLDWRSWLTFAAKARAIVIPIVPGTITAAGISTLYDAFALGKPVIISDCPAVRGIIENEALIVPAGDAGALAQSMTEIYLDEGLRARLSEAGRALAQRVQGEERLMSDVLSIIKNRPGQEASVG